MGVRDLDDEDHPGWSMGRAVELFGVEPAFLRSPDAADVPAAAG
ncbi:hypothetical protein [Pseudonocardia asaccharolytica]|uniref:Uncharacterized protein n=1 Tax=Pseudonocardia asaccharolytica DSM 44247 = NBRC 16224 TaxID=1123024 RepID=A0A511CX23_9PSEU|nr:hypothetical protein [Pseudonocardia asaccharolytica]GEL17111.1 hypothetical protein PA7_09480 [Pseudonocardia asaccharolytica DSM 44247 = NBRC 16224]